MQIDDSVRTVLARLEAAGHQAFLVGGCVRDALRRVALNRGQMEPLRSNPTQAHDSVLPSDWDIATSATPEQVGELFAGVHSGGGGAAGAADVAGAAGAIPPAASVDALDWQVVPTGLKHGTVTLLARHTAAAGNGGSGSDSGASPDCHDRDHRQAAKHRRDTRGKNRDCNAGAQKIEVTTFRRDGDYADGRHPTAVRFVGSIEEDLARRDFTINALAYSQKTGLVDPFGGVADLAAGTLRAVGQPQARLREDALRIMRALRFAATLDLNIEQNLTAALHEERDLLHKVSAERIQSELMRMLPGPAIARVLLEFPDVLAVVVPEIAPTVGFDQRSRHHAYDVWEHSARAVEAAPPDATLRLALLFHDLGKPQTFVLDAQGRGHFPGHAEASAHIAATRLRQLRFSRAVCTRVAKLVRYHSSPLGADSLSRLLKQLGAANLRQLLELRRADQIAHRQENLDKCLAQVDAAAAMLERETLAISGHDLIALGFTQGRELGECLERLRAQVLAGTLANEREALLRAAGMRQ
ncbi:MAG: HD domain-containing protein [Coriobacteriales bacterium]|nr:HD domain-containing protein [Coriobacteriales bacterium]